MTTRNHTKIELETLATFKKQRPSEYFSHIDDPAMFEAHSRRVERLYRFGLAFPPEFFNQKKIIDLGCGTGEHTISLALWGAKCTLVEMNPDAVEIAKNVFRQYSSNIHEHTFINSSLYDIDLQSLRESFDISHSRGVFTHVADKKAAFKILAELARPGGYVIYGDRNTLGGMQEMLQRYAIYALGGVDDQKIVEIAEALFSFDIDRSQRSIPRTREAIIFDRWVIQQQDDPSIEEVLNFFEEEGIEYVNSWPRIDFLGRGASTHSDPRGHENLKRGGQLIELLWMLFNNGELENIESIERFEQPATFYQELATLGKTLRNIQIKNSINVNQISDGFAKLALLSDSPSTRLNERIDVFVTEVQDFLQVIAAESDLGDIRKKVDGYKILFKGFAGVRHVDYIGFKPYR